MRDVTLAVEDADAAGHGAARWPETLDNDLLRLLNSASNPPTAFK